MLIEYSVENYKSMKNETKFSMEAYMRDSRNKERIFDVSKGLNILPMACIYGPNASGKTNVICSIAFLRQLVINSKGFERGDRIPTSGFQFDDALRNESTNFHIDFLNKERYRYNVSIGDGRVLEESLNLKDDLLFIRRDNKVETGKRISTDDRNKLEFIMSLTNENSLLLSKCSQFNIGFTDNAYNWFNEKLCPIRADSLILLSPDKMKGALEKHGSKIISMLNQADFGISDIIMKGTNAEMSLEKSMMLIEKTGPYAVEYEISLPQGCSKKYSIQLEHESAGTKKILGLIISWISALEKGKVLLIDGFESGLHPLLVDFMIGHFYEKDLNKNRAQLILTTYDAALAKRNGFRRDQVWFTARDQAVGTTSLYSWLDYDVRSDLEFTENYLAGRFGAVPNINKSEK